MSNTNLLEHEWQPDRALANHIVLLGLDKHPTMMKQLQFKSTTSVVCPMLGFLTGLSGVVCLSIGLIANMLFLTIGGGLLIIISLIPCYIGRQLSIEAREMSPSKYYCYYCYDLSDQSIKCVIIDRETKEIAKIPSSSDLGYIQDIGQIEYESNGNKSFMTMTAATLDDKNGGTTGTSNNSQLESKVDLITLEMDEKEFCTKITSKINEIKEMGLNNIEMEYEKMYGTFESKAAMARQYTETISTIPAVINGTGAGNVSTSDVGGAAIVKPYHVKRMSSMDPPSFQAPVPVLLKRDTNTPLAPSEMAPVPAIIMVDADENYYD